MPDWLPGLPTISAPTLVACGDHDPNLDGARRVAREIPGARLDIMPMTGHASILERPDLILSLIQDFLGEG
jgi:pimeloyl-ACP methyl ester carboxylesterase